MDNLPSTKAEAKALGVNKYFTGSPCKNGHIAFRYILGNCSECINESTKKRRKESPEIWREYDKKYRTEKPESFIAARKRHYQKYKEYYRQKAREYSIDCRDEKLAISRKSYKKHAAKRCEEVRIWMLENKDMRNKTRREHYKKNRAKVRAYNDARDAMKLSRVPSYWSEIDDFIHQECVELSQLRRLATGFDWQTDHMIPIQAKKACGLHIGCNLQVIPRTLNAKKHVRMIFTKPLEWLAHA